MRPSSSFPWRRAVLAGLVCTLLAAGWVYLFEAKVESIDVGYSGEAARNPFFALQELYTRLGVPSETRFGLADLPPTDGALLLAVTHRPLSPNEIGRLLDWVERGGRLLVGLESSSSEAFLQAVGLESFHIDEDQQERLTLHAGSRSAFSDKPLSWPRLRPVGEPGEGWNRHRDGNLGSASIQSVPVGEGRVTVMANLRFLQNNELGAGNHPDKAWWLIGDGALDPTDALPSTVWIVFRNPPPSVWALLVTRGRPVASALALLCLVGLALFARPFGPRFESPPRGRRHLIEHLRASGFFLWHNEVEHVLLKAEQDAAQEHLARGSQPTREALLKLAEQAVARQENAPGPGEIRAALALPSTQDPQRFTKAVRVLETLRRSS